MPAVRCGGDKYEEEKMKMKNKNKKGETEL